MLLPFIKLHKEIHFPGAKFKYVATNEADKIALEVAFSSEEKTIALFAGKNNKKNSLVNEVSQLYPFGIVAKVKLIKRSEKKTEVEFQVDKRVMITRIFPSDLNMNYNVMAEVTDYPFVDVDSKPQIENRLEIIASFLEGISGSNDEISSSTLSYLQNPSYKDSFAIIGALCQIMEMPFEQIYDIFSTQSVLEQLDFFIDEFNSLAMSKELDREIDSDIRKNLDAQQREFILREKIKVIRKKLGDENTDDEEDFVKFTASEEGKYVYPEAVKKIILSEKRRLKGMMTTSPEANISRTYLDWLQNLPWRRIKIENLDIKKTEKTLDKNHFGLKEVKERILEFIAVLMKRKQVEKSDKNIVKLSDTEAVDKDLFISSEETVQNKVSNVPIITLLGPPGTGKTSLAKSIADAMGRKFVKISLGGVHDESEIRGHRRTYVGAMPGKIIQAIKKAGVSNPIILLDEIDKLSSNYKGDPASAMLEVLDPEQNSHFQDHYLEAEYDLSKVLFIATANYFDGIPEPLVDRVEIIELSSYTLLEKIKICREYLIEKTLEQNHLEKEYFNISDEDIEYIIQKYTREAGVRELKRVLDKLARKIIVLQINKKIKGKTYTLDRQIITKLLGVEKFSDEENDGKEQIGSVNGLAYTQYGGSTLSIEVALSQGKGELKLTGQLKDVMQESAQIALSYVRSNAANFGIKDFDWDNTNIHIHVPEGAVPKDGPSAGVTFTTAIISALTKKPVSHKIGMTGEITLRGKVLAIGGLKEKSLAALKFGIKTVFIPKENERNLEEISDQVKKGLKFIPVSSYEEIFKNIFE